MNLLSRLRSKSQLILGNADSQTEAGASVATYQLLEKAVGWYEAHFSRDTVLAARKAFVDVVGSQMPESELDDLYHRYFLEIFALEFELDSERDEFGILRTPLRLFLNSDAYKSVCLESPGFLVFSKGLIYRHSVYKIERVSRDSIQVRDIFSSEKHVIPPSKDQIFINFNNGDLVQGVVYLNSQIPRLSDVYFFHPPAAEPFIKKQMTATVLNQASLRVAFFMKLIKLHFKMHYLKKMPPHMVYADKNWL